jgi:predicted ArsR family transcriptional regulator
MNRAEHDLYIERLDVTIEVDHTSGEAAFAALFTKYARRWHEATRQAEADRNFAQSQRVLDCADGS